MDNLSQPNPPKPTRVLFLDHTGELGGAERVLLEILEGLDKRVFEAHLACSSAGPLQGLAAPFAELFDLGISDTVRTLSREAWQQRPWQTIWQARAILHEAWKLAAYAKKFQIDFIHSNTLKAHILGSVISRLSRTPLVWHLHDLPSTRGDTRTLLNWAARLGQPRGIIAVSHAAAQDLAPTFRPRLQVVHNGLDIETFDEATRKKSHQEPWQDGPGVILGAVTYLIPWKGLDILLRALPSIIAVHADIKLVIAGTSIFQWREEPDRLTRLAEDLGVNRHVHFLGERNDIPNLMTKFDLFIHPAKFEPFGRVLLEAMAARRAIVACQAGGVPEVVSHGKTGLLVKPNDPQALAGGILELLANDEIRTQMGNEGRIRVQQHFSLEKTRQGVFQAWRDWNLRPTAYHSTP